MKCRYKLLYILFLLPGFFYGQAPAKDSVTVGLLNTIDSIYMQVGKNYVRPVALENFTRKGIDAMYSTLDPFSYYMSKEEADEFRTDLSSQFGGTGMAIGLVDSQVTILEVFKGFPADKASLKPADQILSVDEMSTKGMELDPVFFKLRGTPGTKLNVTVKRPGNDSIIVSQIIREKIKISSVPYYGMLDGQTGYIRLTRVTEKCSDEILLALLALKKNKNMKSLVLDLRNNVGGYFKEALRIANFFITKGNVLVKVKFRKEDSVYSATEPAIDTITPMVILINENTASSAEILSGALQDNDRAVVIGQKSFGKGLVGQIFALGNGKETVLTTGFYYTPSGRCIQSKRRWENFPEMNEKRKVFRTKNGRIVKGEEGIVPDLETVPKKPSPWLDCFLNNNYIFKYATHYHLQHASISHARNFSLDDKGLEDFYALADEKKCNYRSESENKLDQLKKIAEVEGWAGTPGLFVPLEKMIASQKNKELSEQRPVVKALLEQEIAFRYYGQDGRTEAGFKNDAELTKAFEVLNSMERYKKLLNIH